MSTQLELMEEAYRRGILPPDKIPIYEEAKRRGLIGGNINTSQQTENHFEAETEQVRKKVIQDVVGGIIPGQESTLFSPRNIRPVLEMGGAGAGSAIGTPTGPVGMVAGGSIGFAIGKQLADRIETFLGIIEPIASKQVITGTPGDIYQGAKYELFGRGVGKGIEGIGKAAGMLAKKLKVDEFWQAIKESTPTQDLNEILRRSKKVLMEIRSGGEVSKETKKLLKRMEIKTNPTFAQESGSVKAGAFEQSSTAKDPALMQILKNRDEEIRKEGLAYIDKYFVGKEGTGDFVSGLERKALELKTGAELAKTQGRQQAIDIIPGTTTQQIGQNIRGSLEIEKAASKAKVDKLYSQIPKDTTLPPDILDDTIKKITADFKKIGGGSGTYPSDIIRQIRNVITPKKGNELKKVTFDNLMDWNSQIGEDIRAAGRADNQKLVRRLKSLQDGVNDSMDMLSGRPEYDSAKKAFIEYFAKFRDKSVGEVLSPGRMSKSYRVSSDNIPQRFFTTGKMDNADDLVKALGNDKAKLLIDDYVAHNLTSSSITKDGSFGVQAARSWLRKNKTVLDKFGLYNKYDNIVTKQELLDLPIQKLSEFEKSVANKVLGVNPESLFDSLFTAGGRRRSATMMRDLVNLKGVKNNTPALNGLQNGFKDYLAKKLNTQGAAVSEKLLNELKPAMHILYKNDPEKVKAFYDFHKLVKMLQANKNVTYAGGPTTAEKLMSDQPFFSLATNLLRLGAIQVGAGWKFSASQKLAGSIARLTGLFADRSAMNTIMNDYLKQAIYDPEVAQIIMSATKSGPVKMVADKMAYNLYSLGFISYDRWKEWHSQR